MFLNVSSSCPLFLSFITLLPQGKSRTGTGRQQKAIHRFRFLKTSPFKEMVLVNQEFQERRPGWNKNAFIWGWLGLQPGWHRLKKHLNCVLPDDKMGEAYKGKKLQGYITCQELGLQPIRGKGACQAKVGWGSKWLCSCKGGELWNYRGAASSC